MIKFQELDQSHIGGMFESDKQRISEANDEVSAFCDELVEALGGFSSGIMMRYKGGLMSSTPFVIFVEKDRLPEVKAYWKKRAKKGGK